MHDHLPTDNLDNDQADAKPAREAGKKERKKKKPWDPMSYVLWLLGRREYSRHELVRKLEMKFREKELDPAGIPVVLDRADELGLQSDQRFLESQVRLQSGAGKGPSYIRAKLRQHDLSDAQIQQAMDNEGVDWEEEGRQLVLRRFGNGPHDIKTRNKIMNTLLRRGFSFDIAKKMANATSLVDDED